jgi:hypothetical protein
MGVVKRGARSQGEREAKGGEVWGKTRGGQVTPCAKPTLGYLSGVGCFWQASSALVHVSSTAYEKGLPLRNEVPLAVNCVS